jgi:hypothetical protein
VAVLGDGTLWAHTCTLAEIDRVEAERREAARRDGEERRDLRERRAVPRSRLSEVAPGPDWQSRPLPVAECPSCFRDVPRVRGEVHAWCNECSFRFDEDDEGVWVGELDREEPSRLSRLEVESQVLSEFLDRRGAK